MKFIYIFKLIKLIQTITLQLQLQLNLKIT